MGYGRCTNGILTNVLTKKFWKDFERRLLLMIQQFMEMIQPAPVTES